MLVYLCTNMSFPTENALVPFFITYSEVVKACQRYSLQLDCSEKDTFHHPFFATGEAGLVW